MLKYYFNIGYIMDLNKDNRDVYTIDSESYSEYMQENRKKPRDLLSTVIQFLIVILLIVLVYFFFNILKNDLAFSEVFNKKELFSTYESLMDSDEKASVENENYSEVLAEKIAMVVEEKPREDRLIIEQDDAIAKKVEEKEETNVVVVPVTKVVIKETKPTIKIELASIAKEEPTPLKIVKVEAKPVEVIENIEVPEETELTENYLDRMVAELNSI